MQLIDGIPVYAATDLVGFLACEALTTLDRAALEGLLPLPRRFDADLEILQKRGLEHEDRFRTELAARGKRITQVQPDGYETAYGAQLRAAVLATEQAMAEGRDVIYQGTFFDGCWRGHPDFLLRVDDPERPSRFGPYHYEVADAKLARTAKAGAVLQVCSYVDQLRRVQGVQPREMHLVLGGSARRTETLRVDDFMAYYRSVRERFLAVAADRDRYIHQAKTATEPVEHCMVCRWEQHCEDHRRRVDHLSLVAGITTRQRAALAGRGLTTLADLGRATFPFTPALAGTSPLAAQRVREQARIQLAGRDCGQHLHELLTPIEPKQGLASLPAPSPGDLFFDIEGDPYAFDDGIDYLFGVLEPGRVDAQGEPLFHAIWSTDALGTFSLEAEKRAFEALIDLIMERWARDPGLHVYHYAPYEPTALKRLMGRYGTREDEVDRLLRAGVLVDLYRAVRQGLRASVESYSIKKLEPLYGFTREVDLRTATASIVEFEHWLQLGADERPSADHLDRILRYNRDDVVSTWRLRDWLEEQRGALLARGVDVPRPARDDDGAPSDALGEQLAHVNAVAGCLTAGVPVDPAERSAEQHARWLLAQLLSWHRREEKSTWWLYYHLMNDLTDEERIEAKEPLGGLEFVDAVGELKRSIVYRYHFPPQEHDISVGTRVHDPATGKSAGTVVVIDDGAGLIDLSRDRSSKAPHPTSLVPDEHVSTDVLQKSLLCLGEWVAEHGMYGTGLARAGRDLLLRAAPRLAASKATSCGLQAPGESTLDAAVRLVLDLDESVLPIQGPPGAGKTYIGAHMIVALLATGRRVGITANSHKVIANLLAAACSAARDAGVPLRAVQRGDTGDVLDDPCVTPAADNAQVCAALASGSANLVAGTAWLWAREEMRQSVDVLFVDEAGQLALANALAVSPAARSLVLLGDPQQLDQPIKGSHPSGVAVSALGHILEGRSTIAPDRGLFLEDTWRLHPAVCRFTSAAFYDGKLRAQPSLAIQRLVTASERLVGTGPLLLHVPHAGNDNASVEEADAIAELARDLVDGGSSWIDRYNVAHPVTWSDVLIVAPYNAQVAAIRERLPAAARVGTVDKFQGQEAPVAIYSMASSSAEYAPRGLGFLFNRNRLNVATSRARCVAIVVCSPELLSVRARTVEEMRLANTLCLFGEHARAIGTASPALLEGDQVRSAQRNRAGFEGLVGGVAAEKVEDLIEADRDLELVGSGGRVDGHDHGVAQVDGAV
jgi:uncharacterized protein